MAAEFVWQSLKVVGSSEAVVHQFRLRNVAMIINMAKSATDSEDAAALQRSIVRTAVRGNTRRSDSSKSYLLQYIIPI